VSSSIWLKSGIIDPTKVVRCCPAGCGFGRRPADHHRGDDCRASREEGPPDGRRRWRHGLAWATWTSKSKSPERSSALRRACIRKDAGPFLLPGYWTGETRSPADSNGGCRLLPQAVVEHQAARLGLELEVSLAGAPAGALAVEQPARLILQRSCKASLRRLALGGGMTPVLRIGGVELVDRFLGLRARTESQPGQEKETQAMAVPFSSLKYGIVARAAPGPKAAPGFRTRTPQPRPLARLPAFRDPSQTDRLMPPMLLVSVEAEVALVRSGWNRRRTAMMMVGDAPSRPAPIAADSSEPAWPGRDHPTATHCRSGQQAGEVAAVARGLARGWAGALLVVVQQTSEVVEGVSGHPAGCRC